MTVARVQSAKKLSAEAPTGFIKPGLSPVKLAQKLEKNIKHSNLDAPTVSTSGRETYLCWREKKKRKFRGEEAV